MTEGQLMIAAALINAAVCRSEAKVTAMRIEDDWQLKFGQGQVYSFTAYEEAVEQMVYDPQESINQVMDWWGTGIQVKKDGDQWCATQSDFINLQESPAGFGNSPKEAVDALLAEVAK